MKKHLVSEESLEAYKDRFETMLKQYKSAEGDKLFISKVSAVSEQIENLHVETKIGDFVIESDGPKDLGGSGTVPGPMPMLLASIANCLEITALLYLSLSNMDVNSISVKVEALYDKRSSLNPKVKPLPGFFDIKYAWYVETDEKLKKIDQVLRKVEEICPVKGTLNKDHKFPREIHLVKEGL